MIMMTTKKISNVIGFAGKMRSGKTQSALYLVDKYDYIKLSCAGALKKLCAKLLNVDLDTLNKMKNDNVPIHIQPDETWVITIAKAIGVEQDIIRQDLKDVVFKDVRDILQYIGTDIIRKHKENWHVDILRSEISSLLEQGYNVVIDDVRFTNECDMIKEFGGEVYFVSRRGYNIASTHESENILNGDMFDYYHTIYNNQDIEYLNWIVEQTVCHRND